MENSDLQEYLELKLLYEKGKLKPNQKPLFSRLKNKLEKAGLLPEQTNARESTEAAAREKVGATKKIKLVTGREVTAKLEFVEAENVKSKVQVHHLNPRIQNALTKAALWDILPLVEQQGVVSEGVACLDSDGQTYLAIDCSRRRKSAIFASAGLPLWLIEEPLTDEEVEGLIETAGRSRGLSRRELGQKYLDTYNELGTFKAVYEHHNIPANKQKTVERNLKAALVNELLIQQFVDPMGIPNTYYDDLAKIEKGINKKLANCESPIATFVNDLDVPNIEYNSELSENDIRDAQEHVLTALKNKLKEGEESVSTWSDIETIYDDVTNKNKYVRKQVHKGGRKIKFECSYLTRNQSEVIDSLLISLDNEEKLKQVLGILNS